MVLEEIRPIVTFHKSHTLAHATKSRESLFGGMERWNGMVEWNGGMEQWNGIVEWNGGIVE